MTEPSQPTRPIGRARRIAGNILMGFGGWCWLITVWQFMAHSPRFNYEDWLRFWVVLWTGSALMPFGGWLKFRSWLALGSAAIVFLGEIGFLVWFDHWIY